jgi:hypothetical protein
MINKSIKSEISQRELSNLDVDHLHFDKHFTRIIKSGSLCRLVALGDLISC